MHNRNLCSGCRMGNRTRSRRNRRPGAGGMIANVTDVASENWAGYAATGAAGSLTSVSSSWPEPAVTCGGTDTTTAPSTGGSGGGSGGGGGGGGGLGRHHHHHDWGF
jgi:hypothetical protein